MYLAPEPTEPFVELTKAVWRSWPDHPPYEGAYDKVIPHLTVALGNGSFVDLREALARQLPIAASAHEVWLIARPEGEDWRCSERFQLEDCR